jgi:anaerobic selenocysteine-containing dehydrogenase
MILRDYKPSVGCGEDRGRGEDHSDRPRVRKARPAIAMGDRGVSRYPNGLYTRWSIHCLNALVGNIDQPGGILTPPEIPFTPLPSLVADPVAEHGRTRPRIDGAGTADAPLATSAVHRLPDAIRSGEPYPV